MRPGEHHLDHRVRWHEHPIELGWSRDPLASVAILNTPPTRSDEAEYPEPSGDVCPSLNVFDSNLLIQSDQAFIETLDPSTNLVGFGLLGDDWGLCLAGTDECLLLRWLHALILAGRTRSGESCREMPTPECVTERPGQFSTGSSFAILINGRRSDYVYRAEAGADHPVIGDRLQEARATENGGSTTQSI